MTTTTKTVVIRAKAFATEGIRSHRCRVEIDGTVRVWDSIAGHYTACHSLSRAAQSRARELAMQS